MGVKQKFRCVYKNIIKKIEQSKAKQNIQESRINAKDHLKKKKSLLLTFEKVPKPRKFDE